MLLINCLGTQYKGNFFAVTVQGLYQMLEDKVSVRCRQKDEKLLTVSILRLSMM